MTNANYPQISEVYNLLSMKIVKTLFRQLSKERINNEQYAVMLSQCLQAILQLAVEFGLTQAQMELAKAQAKETLDLIDAKKDNLTNQGAAEDERKELYKRQAKAYDDNLRVEACKQYGNSLSMVYAGGTKVDEKKWRELYIFTKQIVNPEYNGNELPPLT